MGDSKTVNLVPEAGGDSVVVPVEEAASLLTNGFRLETGADLAQKASQSADSQIYGGPAGAVVAGGASVARGMTGGLSDAGLSLLGAGRHVQKLKEHHQEVSIGGEVLGSMSPTGVGGLAARAGTRVARGISEASTLGKLAKAGVQGAVENAIQGVGTGVSAVALSEKPLDIEHMASTIGSEALFGAGVGGAVGVAGKGLELGLSKAKSKLDEVANATGTGSDDIARLDRKGLKAAERTELEAIESARVPQRAAVADEIKTFRQELKDSKLWLATKGAEEAEIRAIGKRTLKADRQLDNLLDDPKALAENPKPTLSALRKQEAALDELVNKHAPSLRTKFAADETGTRAAALDYATAALEKNRALQQKIADLAAKPASSKLDQIASATEALNAPKPKASLGDVAGDFALGHLVGAAAGIPGLGPVIAGVRIASAVVEKLGANKAVVAARGAKAVQTFLDVTKRVAPYAPVVATKVLSSVRYGNSESSESKPTLAGLYKQRADEIRSQTTIGETGELEMHPAAREEMASKLAPIRAVNPLLADRIETNKARAMAFLASKLPKKPDIAGMKLGPDTWKPSDMEMRQFARYAAAVDDPTGVLERAATGTVSPEDAETMQSVYPEMHAEFTRQVITEMQKAKKPLPYARRLSLSILTGVAVDPALDPRVLGILQGSFAKEEGTSGGVEAPRAQPAFGSVSKDPGTPAQQRAAR